MELSMQEVIAVPRSIAFSSMTEHMMSSTKPSSLADTVVKRTLESKCDMVILHTGHRDLWRGDKLQEITDNYIEI